MSRLTPQERADRKASFQKMNLPEKAEYIFSYYKLPILVGLAVAYFASYTAYQQITKKDAVLYEAHINVSVGADLESRLSEGFILSAGANPKKTEVDLYKGLYLSDNPTMENHEYQYASNLKLMAATESKQLDIVLMNREAYDILSQRGYLLDLRDLLASNGSFSPLLASHLTENTVILEDNSVEYTLNQASRYEAVTQEVTNGLEVSAYPLFQEAGFQDPIYLGVIVNSPRVPAAIQYMEYLAAAQGAGG